MNELDYVKSILLGALQGATEFLPISSSGHLALAQRWWRLDPDGTPMLLFDLLAHFGTLVAVIVVFRRPTAAYLGLLWPISSRRNAQGVENAKAIATPPVPRRNGVRREPSPRPGHTVRPLWLAVVATVPTAAIGLLFKEPLEAAFDRPRWIGVCLIVTGCLLAALAKVPRGRRGWRDYHWFEAVVVGLAQGLAILPGISRSGATIATACYLGWRRRWAAEFSFLIIVPAIVGGTILKLTEALHLPDATGPAVAWGPILLGSATSLLVGIAALRLLLDVVRRAKLHYFALYCWLLGAAVILVSK